MYCADALLTGAVSMRVFHTLFAGKRWHVLTTCARNGMTARATPKPNISALASLRSRWEVKSTGLLGDASHPRSELDGTRDRLPDIAGTTSATELGQQPITLTEHVIYAVRTTLGADE